MDLRARQDTYNGFGNALSRAVELVAAPLLLALLGWLFSPVAALVLGLVGVVGQFLRMYYAYSYAMDRETDRVLKRGDR